LSTEERSPLEEAGITPTQACSQGEIPFWACRAGPQTCPTSELPGLLHTALSLLALP